MLKSSALKKKKLLMCFFLMLIFFSGLLFSVKYLQPCSVSSEHTVLKKQFFAVLKISELHQV